MAASRWSARSDTRRWRRSRVAAYPKHPRQVPFSDIAAFRAPRGRAVARAHVAVGPRTRRRSCRPPPRPGTEPSKYQRLIEGDGQWRLRHLLLAHCRPDGGGDPPFAVRFLAPGQSLSARGLNQPRRRQYQVNRSAVVVLDVTRVHATRRAAWRQERLLASREPTLDSTGPEGRIRMHGPLVGELLRCQRARNLRCGSNRTVARWM